MGMSDKALAEAYALHVGGRPEDAATAYARILDEDPNHLQALILFGVLRLQGRDFQHAEALLARAAAIDPNSFDALSLRAAALQQLGQYDCAIALLDRVLELHPQHAQTWNNRGGMLLESGRTAEAVRSFDRAIAIEPSYPEALYNRAMARIQAMDFAAAKADLDQAIAAKPDYTDAWEYRGYALLQLGAPDHALENYEAALRINPQAAGAWRGRGDILYQREDYAGALENYSRALTLSPNDRDALRSRGGLLNFLQRYQEAAADFDQALSLKRDDPQAWLGRGNALARLNHEDEALASYDECLRLQPDERTALNNRANLMAQAYRYEEAQRDIEALLAIDPDYPLARGLAMHIRLNICDWSGLSEAREAISSAFPRGTQVIRPFGHLLISDSAEEQLRCARINASASTPVLPRPLYRGERYRHERIRVAYITGDFCIHAVAFLIAGVFEHHDRDRFETFGISYSPRDGSAMQTRLEKAFSRFIDVREMSDAAVASMLRGLEIDIAIDLKGYTGGARAEVLAYRPAPVQVQYLGYPGTMGTSYLDYLIADPIVIPESDRAFYAEQIVYLPDTYQPNDSNRQIGAPPVNRTTAGLPEQGFVFCCFNGSQKILPGAFGLWMEILSKTDGSVLWLFDDNPLAAANLRREAEKRGVAAERLIFAKRLPLEQHLARLQLADLVLDTLPYGAHTTASDALWAGVPVLTRIGTAFAGRVAASLLHAVGLPELVTQSAADYVARACELAAGSAQLAKIKAKLSANRLTMPLFDTARITRHLERAYIEMKARHDRGEPPRSFSVR